MRMKSLYVVGALLSATALGACTSAQEMQVLNDIEMACVLLPIGTTITATILSSIPLASPIAPIVQVVGNAATNDCNALYASLQSAIEAINGQGGTATVNVSTNNAAASATLRKLVAKYHAKMTATANTVTFVVPPAIF